MFCSPHKWTSTISFLVTYISEAHCQGLIKNNPANKLQPENLEQISWDEETLASVQHSQHLEHLLCQWLTLRWAFWMQSVFHRQELTIMKAKDKWAFKTWVGGKWTEKLSTMTISWVNILSLQKQDFLQKSLVKSFKIPIIANFYTPSIFLQ